MFFPSDLVLFTGTVFRRIVFRTMSTGFLERGTPSLLQAGRGEGEAGRRYITSNWYIPRRQCCTRYRPSRKTVHHTQTNTQQARMSPTIEVDVAPVDEETNARMLEDFTGEKTGWVQIGPQKYIMPSTYTAEAQNISNFKTRADDVWICTFPRSGTTLTQEMVWLIANDFDFETAKRVQLMDRYPFFEFSLLMHPETKKQLMKYNEGDVKKQAVIDHLAEPMHKLLKDAPSPRFIKTHLPPSLLPLDIWSTGAKVIYVARNPKDVAASYYHLSRLWRTIGYTGDRDNFWDYFQKGLVLWAPFWPHIKEGWECRNNPNVLFLFYEDIVKDMTAAIHKVGNFLGYNTPDDKVKALVEHLDVKNFKNNAAVNFESLKDVNVLIKSEQPFIRKGKTGSSTSEFSEECMENADQWVEENYKTIDLRFPTV